MKHLKENDFTLKKARSRWYPAETMRDADYADDQELLANTPAQVESLLPAGAVEYTNCISAEG